MKNKKLVKIAFDLLDRYEAAQESLIWEYSTCIKDDTEKLYEEVASLREQIREASKEAEGE